MEDKIEFSFDEVTGKWEQRKEPYATVEFVTEEDYNFFIEAVKFYEQHNEEEQK